MKLKRTPLYETLKSLSGKFVDFAGWEMPIQFKQGVIQEHLAVRNNVGIFDVSHMGKIAIQGGDAINYLNYLTVNDVNALNLNQAQYTAMCDEDGKPYDDMILYRLENNLFYLVVNASNFDKVWAHMLKHKKQNLELTNISNDYALLAVQGPNALPLMNEVLQSELNDIGYYHFRRFQTENYTKIVARLGYTGENGFEVFCPVSNAISLWNKILQHGEKYQITICGLGARDTLRTEACFPLYGNELDSQHNLYESKLGWIIKLNKGNFLGSQTLKNIKEQGVSRQLVFFVLEKGIPRKDYLILDAESPKEPIGVVTSGTMSPILQQGIGMGFVAKSFAKIGQPILIRRGNKDFQAKIVKPPFVKKK